MRVPAALLLPAMGFVTLASLLLAISIGSGQVGPAEAFASLFGETPGLTRDIVLQLRLPRAIAAFGTGAALAIAGVLMQALLRNPLADPYILGTSGGAAVGALGAMLGGLAGFWIDAAAFGGALASTLIVFGLAHAGGGRTSSRLLLTGVVMAAGWGAVISLLLATSPEANLRGMLFWLMGDFAFVTNPWPVLTTAAIALLISIAIGPSLNVLTTGDTQAALLGLAVDRVRLGLYFLGAGLTAIAVTTAGTVGFVGLVVPHLIRLVSGADHRSLLPASALAGGSLLVVADTMARSVLAPVQLPVGAITALVGVPLFLVLLRRDAGGAR